MSWIPYSPSDPAWSVDKSPDKSGSFRMIGTGSDLVAIVPVRIHGSVQYLPSVHVEGHWMNMERAYATPATAKRKASEAYTVQKRYMGAARRNPSGSRGKRKNPTLVEQVQALPPQQRALFRVWRGRGSSPAEALALAREGRYAHPRGKVKLPPNLTSGLESARYVQKDAREALDAALASGRMDGVEKYARQIKAAKRKEADIQAALDEVGLRARGHYVSTRDKGAREWYEGDFRTQKIAGQRAGVALKRRNPRKGFTVTAVESHHFPGVRWRITLPDGSFYESAGGFYDSPSVPAHVAAVRAGRKALVKGTYMKGSFSGRGR